ncbi:MAG: Rossmann-like and DUF2520 domain-containing protein [Ignavibacteria bacterium]
MKNVTIIGVGKVGSALAIELSAAGFNIVTLIDKNLPRLRKIKSKCRCKDVRASLKEDVIGKSDVIIICLKDDNIQKYITEISKFNFKGKIILHTSGLLTSDIFKPLKVAGVNIGSFHPAQTFSKLSLTNNKLLTGIYFGIEGGKNSICFIKKAAAKLKSGYVIIPKNKKALYHLSCVVSSNFLIANFYLLKMFSKSLKLTESKFLEILKPLFYNTAKNIHSIGVSDSLTGPVSRGDTNTINSHLNLLHGKYPKYVQYYKATSMLLTEVAGIKNKDINFKKISELLKNE